MTQNGLQEAGMLSRDLQQQMVNWTVKNSGHQDQRSYIGLSGIGDCDAVIYDRYFNGSGMWSVGEHLRSKLSFEIEEKLIERLGDLGVYRGGETISLYDGLVQGHTDGLIEGRDILEIKTVPLEAHIPDRGKLPNRVFYQVQAYLHFLKREWCHVVYVARDTGMVYVAGIGYKPDHGSHLADKVRRMATAVLDGVRPACVCGRCAPQTMVVERMPRITGNDVEWKWRGDAA